MQRALGRQYSLYLISKIDPSHPRPTISPSKRKNKRLGFFAPGQRIKKLAIEPDTASPSSSSRRSRSLHGGASEPAAPPAVLLSAVAAGLLPFRNRESDDSSHPSRPPAVAPSSTPFPRDPELSHIQPSPAPAGAPPQDSTEESSRKKTRPDADVSPAHASAIPRLTCRAETLREDAGVSGGLGHLGSRRVVGKRDGSLIQALPQMRHEAGGEYW